MPPMPMPPLPPGIGMLQAMSLMPGGAPPPGIHIGMEPPGLPPPGLSQDEQLKMVQHRAAMVLQQEERAQQQVKFTDCVTDVLLSASHFKHKHNTEMQSVCERLGLQENHESISLNPSSKEDTHILESKTKYLLWLVESDRNHIHSCHTCPSA